ncbi:MAG: hypothetical protein J5I47_12065 [Vicingus serpentipes]|nr:hypothetical protein [Vicingus serpentipes]
MIKSLIAYDIEELEKKKVLSSAKNLYKSKILDQAQWEKIKANYTSKLYSPSIFIRILFFILTLIGLSTISGPLALMLNINQFEDLRIAFLFFGIVFIAVTDFVLIQKNHHYLSGVTEAGIYIGLSFIAFGILASQPNNVLIYPLVGILLSSIAAVRYLNLLGLVAVFLFFGWILFQICTSMGGMMEALLPFIFMLAFGFTYWGCTKLEQKLTSVIFENAFIVAKTLSLFTVYLAGNYYVVRELSIELMNLHLAEGDDIPFAFLFYAFTVLVPLAYLYFGIKKRSLLFIRTSLLTLALSVITLKYYFSLGMPVLTITFSGAILIVISFLLFRYLKQVQHGFTSEKLLNDKWSSKNLTAIIASQTLGGNKITTTENDTTFKGGEFGGGGAGSNF